MKNRLSKLLSILLSVLVLFSACIIPTVVSADNNDTVVYYVKSPGNDKYNTVTDANGTEAKPFETVYDLVKYLNENTTLGAGDTVNAYILQRDNVTDYSTAMIHGMTSWTDSSASNLATVPAHKYTLVLKSPEGQNNYLAFSYKINDNVDLMLNGPTVFDNVTLVNVNNSAGKSICLEGNDATFTENCKFQYLRYAYNSEWNKRVYDLEMPIQMSRVHTANKTHAGSTINLNTNSAKLYLPTSRNNNKNCTYTDDVKIVVDNPSAQIEFIWGNANATSTGTAKFKGDLTFEIKAAASIKNTAAKGPVVIEGALQTIIANDINVTGNIAELSNLTFDSNKYWYIKNELAKDELSFTDTPGTFATTNTNAVATDSGNNPFNQSQGKFTLAAGVYKVVEGQNQETVLDTYYVKSPGSDNYNTPGSDGTEAKPFETVYDLVSYLNAKTTLGAGDTVNVCILQRDDIKDYNKTTMLHNITAWTDSSASNLAPLPEHKYTLVLKSPEGQNNYLAFSYKINDNVDLMLSGPTVFDNVTLLNVNNSSGKSICLEGHDATFTENAKFEYLKGAYNSTWDSKFTVLEMPIQMSRVHNNAKQHSGSTINLNAASAKLYLPTSRNNGQNCTYTDDVKIIVDNPSAAIEFIWGNANATSTGTATFKGDLTFEIKAASKITNTAAKGPVVIEGALQTIMKSSVIVTGDIAELSNVTFDNNKYWYIKNSLKSGTVSFTDTAGIFETTNPKAIAIDSSETVHNQSAGKFTLTAGTYNVADEQKEEVRLDTYYVKSPGSDNYNTTDSDGTKDKPFETVYDLVAYLNENTTFAVGDTVNVCILQRDDITAHNASTMLHNMTSWTDSSASNLAPLPNHKYTLSIKSPEGENNYLAYSYKIADNVDLMLSGPTVFDNVTIVNVRHDANKSICLEGHDATFTENCEFRYLANAYDKSWDGVFKFGVMPVQMSRIYNIAKVHSSSKITLNSSSAKLYIPTSRSNDFAGTFTGDTTIVVDNPLAVIEFVWGNAKKGGAAKCTFEGNILFDIKSANSITNTMASGPVVVKGAVQVLIDDDSYCNNKVIDFDNVTLSQSSGKDNYWHLRNGTDVKDAITFTDTAGTFAVKNGMDVVAQASDGSEISPVNNKLTLSQGEYVIKFRGKDFVDPLTVGKMIYFKNGSKSNVLAAYVNGTPGKKYIFKYSTYSTETIEAKLLSNGKRNTVKNAVEFLKEEKHGNYTTYTYRITIPDNYEDANNKAYLGVDMPLYAEGYLFGMECYEEGDDDKKSAWDNGNFSKGFDGWIWGWTVVSFVRDLGSGATEWSDGSHVIKLIKYDLSLIDTLINDLYRDDGEWYIGKDVELSTEEIGYATLKGTYLDQNGEPLSNVKMILKSEDNTYTAYTDSNGNFTIKNVKEGYYELYYVNTQGEEVTTDFLYSFEADDVVTIKLTNDSSVEIKVSVLNGTVYTPDLKTVSGLKIYLRGFGEVTTDKNGSFTFADVPVGKYDVYTVLEDGSEYVFRTVEIKENVDLAVKLKYGVQSEIDDMEADSEGQVSYWIWIIIACGALIIVAAVIIVLTVLKKKKKVA